MRRSFGVLTVVGAMFLAVGALAPVASASEITQSCTRSVSLVVSPVLGGPYCETPRIDACPSEAGCKVTWTVAARMLLGVGSTAGRVIAVGGPPESAGLLGDAICTTNQPCSAQFGPLSTSLPVWAQCVWTGAIVAVTARVTCTVTQQTLE